MQNLKEVAEMKRLLSLVLIICLMITFAGCTGSDETEVTEPVAEETDFAE